jgi:hypothetical protein
MILYFGASILIAGLSLWFAISEFLKLRKIDKGVKQKVRPDENLESTSTDHQGGRPKPK